MQSRLAMSRTKPVTAGCCTTNTEGNLECHAGLVKNILIMMTFGNMRCSTKHKVQPGDTHIMVTVGLWQRQCGFLALTAVVWTHLD